MFVWGSMKKKPRFVEGGEFRIRKCPECGNTREFRECMVKRSVSVYSVIKLWEGEEYQAWACIGCGSVMDLEDTLEPELSGRDERRLARQEQRKLEAAEAKAKAEAKRIEREREEQRRAREREKVERAQQVEDELAAIKRRLGKS